MIEQAGLSKLTNVLLLKDVFFKKWQMQNI